MTGTEQPWQMLAEASEDYQKTIRVRAAPGALFAGRAYAEAITEVIAGLNRALAARVPEDQLAAADAVLRASIDDERVARLAAHLTPPPHRPP